MTQTLRVSLESPQSGWMSLGMSDGEQRLAFVAAHAPHDSVRDLIEGLAALLSGARRVTVRWNAEPEGYDLHLWADGRLVELEVVRYPDRRDARAGSSVFTARGEHLDVILPIWRALRDLHRRVTEDEFAKNWRREFPETEMRRLTKMVRAARRAQRGVPARGND